MKKLPVYRISNQQLIPDTFNHFLIKKRDDLDAYVLVGSYSTAGTAKGVRDKILEQNKKHHFKGEFDVVHRDNVNLL